MNAGLDKDDLQNPTLISVTLIISVTHISSLDVRKDSH